MTYVSNLCKDAVVLYHDLNCAKPFFASCQFSCEVAPFHPPYSLYPVQNLKKKLFESLKYDKRNDFMRG